MILVDTTNEHILSKDQNGITQYEYWDADFNSTYGSGIGIFDNNRLNVSTLTI